MTPKMVYICEGYLNVVFSGMSTLRADFQVLETLLYMFTEQVGHVSVNCIFRGDMTGPFTKHARFCSSSKIVC